FSPFSASRVRVGVLQGPPNVLVAPKPTSSSSTRRMFGAPAGAFTGCGKSDFESLARRLMAPRNGWGGVGSTAPPGGGGAGLSSATANRPDAVNQPSSAPAASIATAARVVRHRMVSTPEDSHSGPTTCRPDTDLTSRPGPLLYVPRHD